MSRIGRSMRRTSRLYPRLLVLTVACVAACGAGNTVQMDFTRQAGLFAAPFPSDELRAADGSLDLSRWPNPDGIPLVAAGVAMLDAEARGFALSAATFFTTRAPIDAATLPDLRGSARPDAAVFLAPLDRLDQLDRADSRTPVIVGFEADGGPFGAPNLLSLLPLQGAPLEPATAYAAVVRRTVLDASGAPLGTPEALTRLAAGERPPGLSDAAFALYRRALAALAAGGLPASSLAGLAVFTTDDPTATLGRLREDVLSRPLPVPEAPPVRDEVFDDYCVYSATLPMPDYQQGAAPYLLSGGNWAFRPDGSPVAPHPAPSHLVVTVPRRPMPAGGYPLAVFVRTGGGGDRPLVDRGQQLFHGGPPLVPGSGPARELAQVGFAGVQVDGPLGGLRNSTGVDEEATIFNVANPVALRDNIRESALELIVLAHVMQRLTVDSSACPGAASLTRFDDGRFALFGHSMGATIAPLAAAWEPLYRALILSGAGGSWIENVLWKLRPVPIRPFAEGLLGYPLHGRVLTREGDAALSLVQWAAEPADPQVYARRIVRQPAPGAPARDVLMLQGIVDHYILPQIANALSLPLGLDLGGSALDAVTPEEWLYQQTPVLQVMPLVGRGRRDYPIAANAPASDGTATTAVLAQHAADALEDGHETVFQTDPPKHQYRCFLQSFAAGRTTVPSPGGREADCQ